MTEVIHIKLEHNEALESKKDILNSEIGLLNIVKSIKRFQDLRSEELKTKIKANKKLKELKTNIGKLQQTLPKIKIPEILEEKREDEEDDKEEMKKPKIKEKIYDSSLENQLQEIQEKLRQLG